jgi:hypothetical protein
MQKKQVLQRTRIVRDQAVDEQGGPFKIVEGGVALSLNHAQHLCVNLRCAQRQAGNPVAC